MARIGVLAEHADETAALDFVDSLEVERIENVDAGVAFPLARLLGQRVVCVNGAFAYPGDRTSPFYEIRRAPEMLEEYGDCYAIANMHNFMGDYGVNFAAVDAERGVNQRVLGFLGRLGISTILLTSYGGIQHYARNAFALELDPNGLGRDHKKLRAGLDGLANWRSLPEGDVRDFSWFTLLSSAHADQLHPDNLSEQDQWNIRNFRPLSQEAASQLGIVCLPARLITWRRVPNTQGYWGEVVAPAPVPDDFLWQA